MKIISLNLNGIRAALRKGLEAWLLAERPDFVCVQELKAQAGDWNDPLPLIGLEGYFSFAQRRGYSGVGIYSRHRPQTVVPELGISTIDNEGRFVRIDFENWVIISLYLPSGSSGRQEFKYQVMDVVYRYLEDCFQNGEGRQFIVCGDWNIAHTQKDICNWRGNQKNSGFLPQERAWFSRLIEMGWVDVFRSNHDESGHYTWWSNRGRAWDKNVGWRIDYQLATPNVYSRTASIYKAQRFSDHAPLIINYQ